MNDNPYQSTLHDIDETPVENRPVSIDVQAAATFFAVTVPLCGIAYCLARWFSYMLPSAKLLLAIACGTATTMGTFAAWRTWNRLTQVHIRRTQLRKNHEQAFAKRYQQGGP